MNTTQAPLKPVIDLLEQVRENRVLQISGTPSFSVQSALNILSGLDNEQSLTVRETTRAEKIKQILGWSPNPQYSVLREVDEAALNWAHNEGYFDQPLHVHTAPPIPGLLNPVQAAGEDNTLVVHSHANGSLGLMDGVDSSSERLFMLFIQGTHQQLRTQPFVLNQSGLSSDNEKNINDWGLSMASHAQDVGTFVLQKSFCEAYAALVLLIGTQGSSNSQQAIQALMKQNSNLSNVWHEGSFVWENHMTNGVLEKTLSEWHNLKTKSPSEIQQWVQSQVSQSFTVWLIDQPFCNTIVDEMLPTFDKRVLDLKTVNFRSDTPPAQLLSQAKNVMVTQWKSELPPRNTIDKIYNIILSVQRTMGQIYSNNSHFIAIKNEFDQNRAPVLKNIIEEVATLSRSTLFDRITHYRKNKPIVENQSASPSFKQP